MSSAGTHRRGLRSFAGKAANAGSAAVVYQAATGNELGGGAEGGSEDSDGMFGHYNVATLGAPSRGAVRLRRDELLYKVQDAAIRGLPQQLEFLLRMEGSDAWPTTSDRRGLAVPLPRLLLLEEKDARGRTPLWLAVENAATSKNAVAVIELLAQKGADINATASVKLSPWELAVFDGMEPGRQTAATWSHKQQVGGCSPFLLATRRGSLHVMRALQELGADVQRPDDDGRNPLCVAAASRGGSSDATLQLLISMGVDLEQPDQLGLTPLAYACAHGNLHAACKLVEAGAQKMALDREGAPPFFQSVRFGHFDMLRPMLERWWPADFWPSLLFDTVDSQGRTACHYAALRTEPDCIRTLWELAGRNGHNLLMRHDNAGRTPLSHACTSYFIDYHRKYRDTGALQSVQFIVSLGSYSQCELSEAVLALMRMDPTGVQCPLLGKQYYEQSLGRSEGMPCVGHGGSHGQGKALSNGAIGTVWLALAEHFAERAGLPRAGATVLADPSTMSGRQLVRQWLEMVIVLPKDTRALVLCHQRLAWASVTHPRLSRSDLTKERSRSRLAQQSPAALLPIDLVRQVVESFPPEYCRFADYPVCWRLLLDARLGWAPVLEANQ